MLPVDDVGGIRVSDLVVDDIDKLVQHSVIPPPLHEDHRGARPFRGEVSRAESALATRMPACSASSPLNPLGHCAAVDIVIVVVAAAVVAVQRSPPSIQGIAPAR